jgi:hypothetical protein
MQKPRLKHVWHISVGCGVKRFCCREPAYLESIRNRMQKPKRGRPLLAGKKPKTMLKRELFGAK